MDGNIQFENMRHERPIADFVQSAIETITDRAPSDSFITAKVSREKRDLYRFTIQVASSELTFDLNEEAHSPFMAIEKAMIAALETIAKWSDHRTEGDL
ncbi:MAG TPA: hypothetical protein PKC28_05570 [Bdellovibrionales bacterium]|nr:hypothetical protein [Bdellovibrionales bacterium]